MSSNPVLGMLLLVALVLFVLRDELNQTKSVMQVYHQSRLHQHSTVELTAALVDEESNVVVPKVSDELMERASAETAFQHDTTTSSTLLVGSGDYPPALVIQNGTLHDILPQGISSTYSNVCLYGSMRFFLSENTTKTFAMNLLTFLRDVSLRSFNDALLSANKNKIKVLIPISTFAPHFESHDELVNFLQPIVNTYSKLDVDFSPNAYQTAQQEFSKTTTCDWVISIKLDADDVLAPGYVDWLVQDVVPSIEKEQHNNNNGTAVPVLNGALVAPRVMPKVTFGYNRCGYKSSGHGYWSGWAVGQAKILRRQVFIKMKFPFEGDAHTGALTKLRRLAYKATHRATAVPRLLRYAPPNNNITLQRQLDPELEKLSGIRMIDSVGAGFGTAGLYLKTPLSGHFANMVSMNLTRTCTIEQWNSVVKHAMQHNRILFAEGNDLFDYVHAVTQGAANMTLLDLCHSHAFFIEGNFGKQLEGNTCEEMELNYRQELSKLPS